MLLFITELFRIMDEANVTTSTKVWVMNLILRFKDFLIEGLRYLVCYITSDQEELARRNPRREKWGLFWAVVFFVFTAIMMSAT